MTQIHAVILDIDGTLVDSNNAVANARIEAMKAYGYDVPFEKVRPLIGMGGDKVLPETIDVEKESQAGEQISARHKVFFEERYLPSLHAFPGSKAWLEAMRKHGLKLAVATSAEEDEAQALLDIVGADGLIDVRTTAQDAMRSKPSPDVMHVALQRVGYSPNEVVMLTDTAYDIEAAMKVGVGPLHCGVVGGKIPIWQER